MNRVLILSLIIISVLLIGACNDKSETETEYNTSVSFETSVIDTLETTVLIENYSEELQNFLSTSTTVSLEVTETETQAITECITEKIPQDGELVRVLDYIPDAVIDLRYATENNFTGTVIYDDAEAYLCYGTVKKLFNVQEELKENGFSIIIWDAYRSETAQYRLWEVCLNPVYVADPRNGITSHSRGNTIDLGIVYTDGSKVELPSGFDEFSTLADRDYSDVSTQAAENSQLLEDIMTRYGFEGYWGEWWHYSDIYTYDLITPDN